MPTTFLFLVNTNVIRTVQGKKKKIDFQYILAY